MIITASVFCYILIGLIVLYRHAYRRAKTVGDPDLSTLGILGWPSTWLTPFLWPIAVAVRLAAIRAAEPLNSHVVEKNDHEERSIDRNEIAVETEGGTLGAMILDNSTILDVCRVLNERMFESDYHRIIFSAIRRLHVEGKPASLKSVCESLEGNGKLTAIGGEQVVRYCVDNAPTAVSGFEYALSVRDRWAYDGYGMSRLWRRQTFVARCGVAFRMIASRR